MALQVRSSARSAERRCRRVVRTVIWVCVLLYPLTERPTRAHAQSKPSRETSGQFRFKVTDSENDYPIAEATLSLSSIGVKRILPKRRKRLNSRRTKTA